jgi:hypothetical protein
MCSGDHLFKEGSSSVSSGGASPVEPGGPAHPTSSGEWYLQNCKTPILTSLRLISPNDGAERWKPSGEDASDHVLSFNHTWSLQDFSGMDHTGVIQFYLNRDFVLQDNDAEGYVSNNITDYLLSLQDKTFYIDIWAGYTRPEGDTCNLLELPQMYKMFTGLCKGGSVSYEYGKIIMTCRIEDYTSVLKGMMFFNSPWFDGMKDIKAIDEILKMAGFKDKKVRDPGSLVNRLAKQSGANESFYGTHIDGRMYRYQTFALPSGYNRLEQPAYKFKDSDTFLSAIEQITKQVGKIFYFDEMGIAHFENYQDIVQDDYLNGQDLIPLYQFTANPADMGGILIFNKAEKTFDVESVYNHIKIRSNDPSMRLLLADHLDWGSVENPDLEGFIGYQKTAFQQQSMFGDIRAVMDATRKLTVGFRPITTVTFETYGLPLRATDFVTIGGGQLNKADANSGGSAPEPDIVRVTKVTHTLDAKTNRWWMQVEGQKFTPISDQ